MNALVALDLPGGPEFVDALRRVWDDGDAVLPIDQRLPPAAKESLLGAMRPTRVIDARGSRLLDGARPVEPGDALVVATSGSTGEPKGVILTHANVDASARASSAALEVDASDHWLACLPVAHIGGLSVITRALVSGVPVTVIPAFDAARVTALSHQCTLTSLVATTLRRIDPRLFRRILLGGGRPPDVRPPNTIATYGLTETGSGIVYDGRPLDGVEIMIDSDDEVLVRGAMVSRGYRDGTSSVDDQGWLHTGDIGSLSPDGRLLVAGRRGDVIVTGGQKVWPDPVESVVGALSPGHTHCIIGLPDPEWGERVVLVTDDGSLTLESVRNAVKEVCPAYCAPRQIITDLAIERTALGKIRRAALRERISRSAGTGSTPG